jgi:hypothetical protein
MTTTEIINKGYNMKTENITNILKNFPQETRSDTQIKDTITFHSISFVIAMLLGALLILSGSTLISIGLSI